MDKTTDLNDPADPADIPAVLQRAADRMDEQAAELAASWQDKTAGQPWRIIAAELRHAAARIESKL